MIKTLLIVPALFLFCLHAKSALELVDRVAATVNAEVITQLDITDFQNKIQKNSMLDDLLFFGENPLTLKADSKKALNYLVIEKLFDLEVKKLNLSVTQERVDQEIREIAKRNGASKDDLLTALKSQGVKISEYQDFLKTRLERQSLIEQEITSKIRISDDELVQLFKKQSGLDTNAAQEYTLAHIYFNPQKKGMEQALTRAQKTFTYLKDGKKFEEAAEQNSEDPDFNNGGLLGTFKNDELSKEFAQGLAGLKEGDFTAPIKTKRGVHILKIISQKTTLNSNFEKQKDKLRGQVFEARIQEQLKKWIDIKKDEAHIEIHEIKKN